MQDAAGNNENNICRALERKLKQKHNPRGIKGQCRPVLRYTENRRISNRVFGVLTPKLRPLWYKVFLVFLNFATSHELEGKIWVYRRTSTNGHLPATATALQRLHFSSRRTVHTFTHLFQPPHNGHLHLTATATKTQS